MTPASRDRTAALASPLLVLAPERRLTYDIAIIGGGINGAGIARDAALRGLSVALFEREDWGAGTTGSSTRMIHGGVRYLLYDIPTTRLSSEDAGRIRRIAPHITWRIPFLWPLYPGGFFMREATEAFLSAYDAHAQRKGGLRHARLSAAEARALEPGLAPEVVGALTLDEWGCDAYRLAALNALDAHEHGAHVATHTAVVAVLRSGRDVRGVRVRDSITGAERDVEARVVINAAGPWAPVVAQLADTKLAIRPGKGIHVTFERRIGNYGMILEGRDGRTMFLVPHGAETIVGTTDDDYYGDPAIVDLDITRDEIDYVIEAAARAMPQAKQWRPLRAWAGVRNTVFEWGVDADDLSRRHEIIEHDSTGASGLISLVGGKLASYRIQSEEAVDMVLRRLGRSHAASTTGAVALPGAEAAPDFVALAHEIPLPPAALERIWRRVGSRIRRVFDGATPSDLAPVCRSEAVTRAEIRYQVQVEQCRTLEDLFRHAHVGAGSCDGSDCAAPAAHIMMALLDWTPERTRNELERCRDQRWINRRPVLRGINLAREELIRS
ncbi:MAG TPA: glycerol-3-phosphate dehydrogenase/oxidase [Longimicrobiales bacterium]|nr:glycerol-3-phosphate dehydrogenase/oxidase [Longimicrobiales bacterium]